MTDPRRVSGYAVPAVVALGFAGLCLVVRAGFHELAQEAATQHAGTAVDGATARPAAAPLAIPNGAAPEATSDAVLARDREARQRDDVANALGEQRARYLDQCWSKALPVEKAKGPASFSVTLTFDAEGRETARRLVPDQTMPFSPVIRDCVLALKLPRLEVRSAAGQNQTVALVLN